MNRFDQWQLDSDEHRRRSVERSGATAAARTTVPAKPTPRLGIEQLRKPAVAVEFLHADLVDEANGCFVEPVLRAVAFHSH